MGFVDYLRTRGWMIVKSYTCLPKTEYCNTYNCYNYKNMKKILLILTILTIGYSCKKQTPSTTPQNTTQSITSNKCQSLGICSEAYYESSSTIQPSGQYDTIIHKTGTNELGQVKLTFIGYGPGHSVPQDTFMYKVSIIDFNPNIIDTNFQFVRYTNKGNKIPSFGIKTKHGLWCIFMFKKYI